MNRKLMTRMVLANWGAFQQPQAVSFGPDTSGFIGVNGSGKSMSLDALQYTLFGITEFNLSAARNESSTQIRKNRTVSDMIHGNKKAEGEEEEILRPGETIFYCVVEFKDEATGSHFLCGNLTESTSYLEKPKGHWFIAEDAVLEDFRFRSDDGSVLYAKNECTLKGRPVGPRFYYNKEQGLNQIGKLLGFSGKTTEIRSAIKKIIAFNPESDVNSFIANSILDDGTGNTKKAVAVLNSITEGYKKADAELVEVENRAQKLKVADEKARTYEKAKVEYEKNQLRHYRKAMADHTAKLDDIRRRKEADNRKLASLKEERTKINNRLSDARSDLSALKSSDEFSAHVKAKESILRSIKNCEYDLKEAEKKRLDLEAFIRASERALDVCGDGSSTYANIREWLSHIGQDGYPERYGELQSYIEGKDEELRNARSQNTERLKKLRDDEKEMSLELRGLQTNSQTFPAHLQKAKDKIIAYFEKTGRNIPVKFFAECINEVTDPKWQPAVEAFLGSRRFQLIVPARYEDEVYDLVKEMKLYGTEVPIFKVFRDKPRDIEPGSVASILDITNHEALMFASHICGSVMLADSEEQVKTFASQGKRSITADGTSSSGYSRRLNDLSGKMYIGEAARQARIDDLTVRLDTCRKDAEKLNRFGNECKSNIEIIKKVNFEDSRYDFKAKYKHQQLEEKLKTLIKEYEAFSEKHKKLDQILGEKEAIVEQLADDLSECDVTIGKTTESISNHDKEADQCLNLLTAATENHRKVAAANPDLEFDVETEYEETRSAGKPFEAPSRNDLGLEREALGQLGLALLSAQQDYRRLTGEVNIESTTGPQYIDDFRRMLNDLNGVEIEKAREKVRKQEVDMRRSLFTDIVAHIGEQITAAKDTRDKLNRELRKHWFGQHQFEFDIHDRKDKEDFFAIYRALKTSRDALSLADSIEYDADLRERVARYQEEVLVDMDSTQYTNYKNYITCDLVIHDKAGKTYRMSRGGSAFSNGEKQTPYLVIMIACLNRLYPENSSAAKLCFIDEAFAAYSDERVREMMLFLKENNIQAVFAAPDKSYSSLAKYMQSVIACAKLENSSYSHYVDGRSLEENAEGAA